MRIALFFKNCQNYGKTKAHINGMLLVTVTILMFLLQSYGFATSFNNYYKQLDIEELNLAKSVLNQRVTEEPDNIKSQLDLGFIHYYLGNFEEALSVFLNLSKQDGIEAEGTETNAKLYFGLALVQHELKQAPVSLKNIVTAYTLAPEAYEVVKLYADISHAMNLHQHALEEQEKRENVNVDLPEVTTKNDEVITYTFKSALDEYKNSNLTAAREQLEILLKDNPDATDALVLLAFIMYREGDLIEAQKIFTELANRETFNENSDVLYGLALTQRNLGNEVEAFESVLRAIIAETTREDLLALYRSLAIKLSIVAVGQNPEEEPATVTQEEPTVTEEESSDLTLGDVIADITELEDLSAGQ